MSQSNRMRLRQQGNVIVIVVLMVGLLVLAVSVAAPLFLRQQNQRNEIETRRRLETAFKALFMENQSRLNAKQNMWSDFGYNPTSPGLPPSSWDLKCLVQRSSVGDSDASHASVLQFAGVLPAWNGPYWQGPVDAQKRPIDAWGRHIQLRYITGSTPKGWQVFSPGANGLVETGNQASPPAGSDDLVYPLVPFEPGLNIAPLAIGNGWQMNGEATWKTSSASHNSYGISWTTLVFTFFTRDTFVGTTIPGTGVILNTAAGNNENNYDGTYGNTANSAGSVFWPVVVDANNLTISFQCAAFGGCGGNGMALAIADADQGMTPSFCSASNTTGYFSWGGTQGMKGVAVILDNCYMNNSYYDYPGAFNGKELLLGLSTGIVNTSKNNTAKWSVMPNYISTYDYKGQYFWNRLLTCTVTTGNGTLQATVADAYGRSLSIPLTAVSLPSRAYIGFTGASMPFYSGSSFLLGSGKVYAGDSHWVGNVSIKKN